MKQTLLMVATVGLVVTACADSTSPTSGARLAPLVVPQGDVTTQVVPNEYLVVLSSPGDAAAQGDAVNEARANGGVVTARWDRAVNGFAARLSPGAVTELRRRPDVAYVEQNGLVHALGVQTPVGSWGQDRVDQRNLPLNNSYTYPNTGAGVHAYIIDTGLNATHTEFTGRVGNGADFTGLGTTNDANGHGTHVAATVGGTTYGLAKGVTLHAVRVLDASGSGTWSGVISGINWVIANKQTPAVANASLGGSASSTVDAAANNLVAAGVTFAVASGNSNTDACSQSPARRGVVNGLISTNASTNTDARASFSNYGTCTDIFAPGQGIKSAWIGSNTATNTISGTSMASPHAAGAAALYLGKNPALTPAQVEAAMKADATTGKITNPGTGSANLLVYVGNIGGSTPPPPPPTNQPPVAKFTVSNCTTVVGTTNKVCTFDGTSSTDDVGVVSYLWKVSSRGSEQWTSAIKRIIVGPPGTYSATLTVTDAGGLSNSLTKSFVVP